MELGYRKKYLWCLVNKHSKIVIFFYDDGSRGRKVLTEFIGDAELAALQSDGYNVYMYLDNELIDVEHLCCLAHARAKFKYAFEQGRDERARCFLEWIGQLYAFEEEYKRERLSFEEIRERRMGSPTADVMNRMSTKISAIYHTFIETCKMNGISSLEYFKKLFREILTGRNDYANLLPGTIESNKN